jgi:hypothetical protein
MMVDLRRDFWIRETGTGQRVAQLHNRYMMIIIIISSLVNNLVQLIMDCSIYGILRVQHLFQRYQQLD